MFSSDSVCIYNSFYYVFCFYYVFIITFISYSLSLSFSLLLSSSTSLPSPLLSTNTFQVSLIFNLHSLVLWFCFVDNVAKTAVPWNVMQHSLPCIDTHTHTGRRHAYVERYDDNDESIRCLSTSCKCKQISQKHRPVSNRYICSRTAPHLLS